MERLTKRRDDGSVIIATKCPEWCEYATCSMEEGYQCQHQCESDIIQRLADYEDAEEQGLLLRLPCKVGDDIYYIPSEVNYKLNILNQNNEFNKVHHQKVSIITYTKHGWHIECDKDIEYETGGIFLDKMFKETWFLTQEEAEKALADMGV